MDQGLLPVLILQREMRSIRNFYRELRYEFETLDTPFYIWVPKGTILTPDVIMKYAYYSMWNSMDSDARRESFDKEIMQDFENQRFLTFGSTMNIDQSATPITAEYPLQVPSTTSRLLHTC
jgi:hypothetical protein